MTHLDSSQPPSKETQEALFAHELVQTLYWSFHHSQGNQTGQRLLLLYCALQLHPVHGQPSSTLIQHITEEHLPKLRVPHRHQEFDNKNGGLFAINPEYGLKASAGFLELWGDFMRIFEMVSNPEQIDENEVKIFFRTFFAEGFPVKNRSFLVLRALKEIQDKERRHFMPDLMRPNLEAGDERYASNLRAYLFKQKSIPGGPLYAHFYSDVMAIFEKHKFLEKIDDKNYLTETEYETTVASPQLKYGMARGSFYDFKRYVAAWETVHPGESFLPQAT